MNWEEKFKLFKDRDNYEERYGPVVGPWLLEYENRDTDGQGSWRAKLRYEALQGFFRSCQKDVPLWIQEDYIKGLNFNKDYILENLKSHSWRGMWQDLQKQFGDKAGTMEPDHGQDLDQIVWRPLAGAPAPDRVKLFQKLADENSEEGEAFRKIVQFYGYFISKIKSPHWIALEPEYPENASSYVFDDCGGIAYVIVPQENANSVERSGLRCKNGNEREWIETFKQGYKQTTETECPLSDTELRKRYKPYRYFPKRIYFSAFTPDWGTPPTEGLQDVCSELGRNWDDIVVFQIRFWNYRPEIYRDIGMNNEHTFFTYSNIPAEHLKRIIH